MAEGGSEGSLLCSCFCGKWGLRWAGAALSPVTMCSSITSVRAEGHGGLLASLQLSSVAVHSGSRARGHSKAPFRTCRG